MTAQCSADVASAPTPSTAHRYFPSEAADHAAIAYLRNRGVTVSPSVDPEEEP